MVFNAATALTRFYRPASGRSQLLLEDNGRPALELADWKNRIRTDWPGVSIGVLDCIDSRCAWDEAVPLRVEVNMNGLTDQDLRVECLVSPDCVGSFESAGDDVILLDKESESEGKTVFSTRLRPPYPGLQTVRLRVYPYHPGLTHRFEMGAMLWA